MHKGNEMQRSNHRDSSLRQDRGAHQELSPAPDRSSHRELERRLRRLRRKIDHRLRELELHSPQRDTLEHLKSRLQALAADHAADMRSRGSFCDVAAFERRRMTIELEFIASLPAAQRRVRRVSRPGHAHQPRHFEDDEPE